MQFYAKPVDEDFDIVISSIDTLMKTVDFVREIRLLILKIRKPFLKSYQKRYMNKKHIKFNKTNKW